MADAQWTHVALVAGTASLFVGFASLKRHRQIRDVPTSRTRSMPAGPVELVGHVHPEPTLVSPFTRRPCAWWRLAIDEHRGGKHPWREVVAVDSSACPLELVDATGGACLDLTGIDVTPTHATTKTGDRRIAKLIAACGVRSSRRLRVREGRIDAGDPVLVHGVARVGTHVEPTWLRVARLCAARDGFAALPAPRLAASSPRALRPALARRLRALKRAALASGTALDARALAELRERARKQVDAERVSAGVALGRLELLASHTPEVRGMKLEPAEAVLAALLLRVPEVPETAPVVGDDPLAQARVFLLPGDEDGALRRTRYGLLGIAAGIALIAAGLVGLAA
jgi:hypothetical protein